MADLKISQLTGATTPLAGTEVLPIVQGGVTKQVSVANLTAGRTQTSNGIVQGSAATGYNYTANTPAAGMTSQLLNWYEEGTWTPSGFNGTVSGTFSATGRYTRIGRQVTVSAKLSATTSVSIVAGQILVNNLPYSAAVESTGVTVRGDVAEYAGNICSGVIVYSAGTVGANANMFFSITYTV